MARPRFIRLQHDGLPLCVNPREVVAVEIVEQPLDAGTAKRASTFPSPFQAATRSVCRARTRCRC